MGQKWQHCQKIHWFTLVEFIYRMKRFKKNYLQPTVWMRKPWILCQLCIQSKLDISRCLNFISMLPIFKAKMRKKFNCPRKQGFNICLYFLGRGWCWALFNRRLRYQLRRLAHRVRDDMRHLWHDKCVFLACSHLHKEKHNNKSFLLNWEKKVSFFLLLCFPSLTLHRLLFSFSEDAEKEKIGRFWGCLIAMHCLVSFINAGCQSRATDEQ